MMNALTQPLAAESLLSGKVLARDDESRLAAALRLELPAEEQVARTDVSRNGVKTRGVDPKLRRVAGEIVRSVEARLPGRIRELEVRIDRDQFVLAGVASSYYVKQVAQHLAMNALDARMLGRLINEIEVRPAR